MRKGILNIKNWKMLPYMVAMSLLMLLVENNAIGQDKKESYSIFSETSWITAERQIYLPGENINFSAIVLETDTYAPSYLSKVIKIELIDSRGAVIESDEFLLDKSKTDNILAIPSSLPSGWYYIRAYTNWMRNSIQVLDNYFPIKIINPETITQNIIQSNQENKVITIVPESGALNKDFLNQCSVCSMTETGERLPVFAALLNTDNDTIAKFNTDQTGWGIVSFIHQAGEEYSIIDLSTKTELSLVIKETLPEGMKFNYTNTDDYLRISASGLIEDRVKVLVHRNYSWYAQQSISAQGGKILMAIPLDNLPNGILQVSILNMNNEVLFKRLLINGTVIGNNPDILFEEIPGDIPSYTSILTISDRFGEGERLVSNILTRECPLNLFENYIPGLPGWPVSYDIPAGDKARKGWLIANSYPDDVPMSFYPGKSPYPQQVQYNNLIIIEQREAMFSFMPETRGPAISGLLSDSEGKPLRNQLVAATMLSDNSMVAGFTFGSGRFHLSIPGIKDSRDFVIVPTSSTLTDWKLDIEQRFDSREISLPETSFSLSMEEIMYVRELDLNRQLETIFDDNRSVASDTNRVYDKKVPFYGDPSFTVVIDKYVRLTNLREVIFEVVPRVVIRSRRGTYSLEVISDPPLPSQFEPLILLDGIPIYEFNEVLELPPDRFLSIDVFNKLYIHGNAVFSGIVSINSINGDMAGLSLPNKSVVVSLEMPLQGIERIYDISQNSDNIPDLSETLFWVPFGSQSNYNYSFSTNDNQGAVTSFVYGFNSFGQWIYKKEILTFDGESQ